MLKDTEFVYAIARIRSNETKLLSSVTLENMINAPDYKDALRILSEQGYKISGDDAEEVLGARLGEAFGLICESAPEKSCLDFLLVRNDFHNIKAAIKCAVTGKEADEFALSPCVLPFGDIVKSIKSKDYSILPEPFMSAVKMGYELVTSTMDGQALEIFLDRKCLEAMIYFAEKSGDEFSVKTANLLCGLADLRIALRCLGTGKTTEFLKEAVCPCTLFALDSLFDAFVGGKDSLLAFIKNIGFEKLSNAVLDGYAAFEKVCDDIVMESVKSAKFVSFGIAPLVAYYFAVDAEVKTVRIILSCKKIGLDSEIIRERVRVLYV